MIERKFNKPVPHDKLRLHSSERNSSWGDIFEEFKNNLTEEDIRFYPNTEELNDPLFELYGTKNFMVGSGSDRCIKYFFEAHSDYKNLIITNPCFPMYNIYGEMFNMEITTVPYQTLDFPFINFINKVTEDSIIVISNPTSPIGNLISEDDLETILSCGVPTLIDEAYIEFANEKTILTKIEKYSNLFVTRTFSKAMGSAGARFGLIFSNENNIKKLNQYRDMYEITGLTLKWVLTLLTHINECSRYILNVIDNREILTELFINEGYDVIPSKCNWIHIKGFKKLPENIIFKDNCTLPGRGDGWVRLQITDDLNDYICLLK